MGEVLEKAKQARSAALILAKTDATTRNAALEAMAQALEQHMGFLIAENAIDVDLARAKNTEEPLIDRLLLNETRIKGISEALRTLAKEKDPLGRIVTGRTLYNGIRMRQVTVPLGVVAMIYEARPNVTADAAGLTLKTGNACILRGGSMANRSNLAMTRVLYEAGLEAGLPEFWLQSIETTDREATTELMHLHGMIDVLIPRGSASLIRTTVENAKVPVIETGEGNCHLYIHEAADPDIVIPIAINAKTQRPGVCNAIETILVDKAVAPQYVPSLLEALAPYGVKFHIDEMAYNLTVGLGDVIAGSIYRATEEDWATEYLALEIAIKCVEGIDEAIAHINNYGTHHSDSILSQDLAAVSRFLDEVDSAAVYANASTRFTDGGEFGLGAEIGISTQKLHARGPMGLDALTSTKFVLEGSGQTR